MRVRRQHALGGLPALVLGTVLAGCPTTHGSGFPAHHVTDVAVAADGNSAPIEFDVPEGAVSITVVVEGAPGTMYALSSFVLSDGIEHIDPVDPAVFRANLGHLSSEGPDRQLPRFGTFAFQYPTLASQGLPPGRASITVTADRAGPATVHVFCPSSERRTVHVSLVSFSAAMPLESEPPLVELLRGFYAETGVDIVIDEQVFGGDRGAHTFPDLPSPGDANAALVRAARGLLHTNALPIIFVELSEDFSFGQSGGAPCPALVDDDYYGVFVDATVMSGADDELMQARTAAHELGHALGLTHPEALRFGGAMILDPFDDTTGFDDTVMGSGVIGAPLPPASLRFSPQQIFVMHRSALLVD